MRSCHDNPRPKRILFARSADANNFNAQAKNVQHILRHWRSSEYRPVVFSFYAPDESVIDFTLAELVPSRRTETTSRRPI